MSQDGAEVGVGVGATEGAAVGAAVGAVGTAVGDVVGAVGTTVGAPVGAVGVMVGTNVGAAVGGLVGELVDGEAVGIAVGDPVGELVVGAPVGEAVGAGVSGVRMKHVLLMGLATQRPVQSGQPVHGQCVYPGRHTRQFVWSARSSWLQSAQPSIWPQLPPQGAHSDPRAAHEGSPSLPLVGSSVVALKVLHESAAPLSVW